tara:strand:+ start:1245 stop:1442 length:198 start_codon:yes stop_codon:yes gene_type:complete
MARLVRARVRVRVRVKVRVRVRVRIGGEDGAPLRHAEQRLEGGHYAADEEAEVLDLVRVRARVSG